MAANCRRSTNTMTKIFVDEPILIFVDETKIATIIQAFDEDYNYKKLSYRRETARQLCIHAQLTRCFSAVAV